MSLTDHASAHGLERTAPSRRSPLDRAFIGQLAIDHGPRQLLEPFFRDADAAARRAGVRLTFGDFAELVALNKANGDNWGPLIPLFDPANGALHADQAFCLIGRNHAGEAVAAHAVRLFHWPATSFKEEAESLRLFYSESAHRKHSRETCTITAPSAREVRGRVAYSGAAWVRPDYRGRALALVLPRLAKAYAFTRWRPDFIVSWMTEATYKRGLIAHVGYTTIDWAVEMRQSFVGDLRFAFLSMREPGLLDYVRNFSTSLAQVDGRVGQRRA
jgi:hypothetical protein